MKRWHYTRSEERSHRSTCLDNVENRPSWPLQAHEGRNHQLSLHGEQYCTTIPCIWYHTRYDCSVCISGDPAHDRVGDTGLRPCPLPHHRTYGFPYPAVESLTTTATQDISALSERSPVELQGNRSSIECARRTMTSADFSAACVAEISPR